MKDAVKEEAARVGRRIEIAKPALGVAERDAVLAVLESGVLTRGPRVEQFEENFAAYHGSRHAVAVANGTVALVAALEAYGIGPGDEVVVPAFTFLATATAVLAVGATPVVVDIDPDTYCLDPHAAAAAVGARTAALLPVHLFGQIADMPALQDLATRAGLLIVEDAAQAHGATLDGKFAGAWGTACFSFHATKNITTGEGGMVCTNDDAIAERLRQLRNHGRGGDDLVEVLGGNLRLSEIAAALGIVQLTRLEEFTARRRANAAAYDSGLRGVDAPPARPGAGHVYHQYTVRVPARIDRDEFVSALDLRGVGARVYYRDLVHSAAPIRGRVRVADRGTSVARQACREVCALPVHPLLSPDDLARVIDAVNSLC